jgi:peptide/nickel transport system substrate-binding protein
MESSKTPEVQELVRIVIDGGIDRREFLRRAAALGFSATAISTALAACGGTSGTSSPTSTQAASAAASAVKQGGTLIVGPYGDGGDYDPSTNTDDTPYPPFASIYEGLTGYPAGVNPGWNAENLLADSLDKSSDGKTYNFTLKQGIQFHGGFGELTANDVKYSFERNASLIPLWPHAPKSAVSYYAADMPGLERVKVTGKYSGQIIFKHPFAPFETITLPYATSGYVTSQKAVEKYGKSFPLHPIGTGPYEVVSYTPNTEMILRKFTQYGGQNRPLGARNAFDEIRLAMVANNARPVGEALTVPLRSGSVDFTFGLGALDVAQLAGNTAFKTYAPLQSLNYFFLALDVQHPKLKDIRVRQAIRAALNIPQIIQANRQTPSSRLNAIISPHMAVGYWPDAPVYTQDIAKAKALLAQAGATNLTVSVTTPNISSTLGDPNGVMQLIQSNLKQAGISVSIIETPPASYTQKPGQGELLWTSYEGAPDPYYQFEWFTCAQIGVWNYASWCDPTYSKLERELGSTSDPAKRTAISIEMQKLMDASSALIFVSGQNNYSASKASIQPVANGNGDWQLHCFYRV